MSVQKENFSKNVAQKKRCCYRSTRIVFIGPTLILIRTLRLSMRNLPWGFDTTMRLGDGISKNPRIPGLHVDVWPDTGAWSADYIHEATAAWLWSVGIKHKTVVEG